MFNAGHSKYQPNTLRLKLEAGNKDLSNELSSKQIQLLNNIYKVCPYPTSFMKQSLASDFEISLAKIHHWFRTKRFQEKAKLGKGLSSCIFELCPFNNMYIHHYHFHNYIIAVYIPLTNKLALFRF